MGFDPALAWTSLPKLMLGAAMTLGVLIPVLALGIMLAIPLAVLRLGGGVPNRLAAVHVAFFRGVPSLILLYVIYNGLPQLALVRDTPLWLLFSSAYACAVMGLTLTHSAYLTEILRGGLAAVPAGTMEAGRSLGLRPAQIFWTLRLPIAGRYVLQAYQNEVLIMVKSTAAVSAITVVDLTAAANEVFEFTYDPFTPLLSAAALYWLIINATRLGFGLLDRRINAHLATHFA